MNTNVYVFYGQQLWSETAYTPPLRDLPDGAYLYYAQPPHPGLPARWYRKDLTPVLLEDVPKELKTLCLLLGI